MPVQILVIDDDDVSREVLALLLHSAGYAVETVESGDDALVYLQTAQKLPSVVLTDLQMPGTTGNTLALCLRDVCGPATILLAMSATQPDRGSTQKFDGFLLKPFTMEAFTAAIINKTANPVARLNGANATILDEAVYSK